MAQYMEYDYAKSIVTRYYKDATTGVPITKLTKEKQTVNSLKNIIQLIGEPDKLERVTLLDETDMIEVDNYSDVTTANHYYVDYTNSIMYFHPDKQATEYEIEYGSRGLTLIGYGRIFTKLDANGNVLETLQDLIDNGEEQLNIIKVLGDAGVIINKIVTDTATAVQVDTDLETHIDEATPLNTSLVDLVPRAETVNPSLVDLVPRAELVNPSLVDIVPQAESIDTILKADIINGNTTQMRADIDTINNVDLPAINTSLEETANITDFTFNGIINGVNVAPGSGLNVNVSPGIAYLQGKRLTINAMSTTVPASQDIYIDLSNDGTTLYTNSVSIGGAKPPITANSIRIGMVTTNTTSITSYYYFARNTAIGEGAFANNTDGYENVAIGFQSLMNNTTGHRSVAVGNNALNSNTTGHHNVAVGENSLLSNTTGIYNTALGIDTLHDNTTGTYNIAIGQYACQKNISGNGNLGIGISALLNSQTGDGNIAIGQYALTTQDGVSNNIALGLESFRFNTTGIYLLGMGYGSGRNNTTGSRNSFIGYQAGNNNTTGNDNVSLGHSALKGNILGLNNTGVGSYSLNSSLSDNNSSIGYQSLYKLTTGGNNTAIGSQSGYQITTGDKNTFVGVTSGGTTYQNAEVSNSTAIGYGAVTSESNVVQLGDGNVTKVYSHGSFEAQDIGDGFICKSPDGTRYKITVANGGTLAIAVAA